MANSPLNKPQPAWVLDLVHPTLGTFRAASIEMPDDVATLGAFYTKRIVNAAEIVVTDQLSDGFSGIDSPGTVTIILDNHDATYSTTAEWRNVPATLKHYERSTATLTTMLAGVIVDFDFVLGQFIITLSTHDPSIWETLIPRALTNSAEFPSASDNGTPIPIVFGPCFLSPAYCGRDEDSDPGGYDFLLGFQQDQDAATLNVRVEAVYSDTDPNNPGLELLSGWDTAPGTPTYASPTTFTVTGDQSAWYVAGMPMRLVTTASAGAWVYVTVVSYVSGTVTIQGGTLDAGMNTGGNVTELSKTPTAGGTGYTLGDVLTITTGGSSATAVVTAVSGGVVTAVALRNPGKGYTTGTGKVTTVSPAGGSGCTLNITAIDNSQMVTEYLVENSRYASGASDLLSVRTFVAPDGGLVIQANSDMTNPATVIKEILRNTVLGLGESVDATSFSTAATACTNAGLGTCIANALGGDRQQRRAGEVLRELLLLIGGRLSKNPSDGEWEISTDLTAPAAAAVTFGLGQNDTFQNIIRVESNKKASLSEAVSVMHLKFGQAGRVKRSADTGTTYSPGAYELDMEATVLGTVGHDEFITTPWIRTRSAAARVLARLAKQGKFGDRKPVITVGQEGRNVTVGQLVHYENSLDGVDADFRVYRIERRLTDTKLYLAGYDASIFTYSGSDTTLPNDELDVDERQTAAGAGANLVINSDFSAGVRSATLAADMIPGWTLINLTRFTSAAVTIDPAAVGGAYLTLVTQSVDATTPYIYAYDTTAQPNVAVEPGVSYLFSAYLDVATNWKFGVMWISSSGFWSGQAVAPTLRVDTSDVNGLGWKRYYGLVRCPALINTSEVPTGAGVFFQFIANGTFKLDAVQFEKSSRSMRPSIWKRHAKWGVDPALLQTGDMTIRAAGETEHGTKLGHATTTVNTTSGTSVSATALIPAACQVTGVTIRVTTTITGAPSIKIGWAGDANAWGEGIAVAAGTTTTILDFVYPQGVNFPTATDVVITSEGAAFTGGAVKITVHYIKLIAPTG